MEKKWHPLDESNWGNPPLDLDKMFKDLEKEYQQKTLIEKEEKDNKGDA